MFKKLLVVGLATLLSCGVAFAGGGFGVMDEDAKTFNAGGMIDFKSIPNGAAFGAAGGIGSAGADANGFIVNGTVIGDVGAKSAGFGQADASRFKPEFENNWKPDHLIGVGSSSYAIGNTGARAEITVDPAGKFIFIFPTAFGEADARVHGFAAQGTLNGSYLTESPKYFSTTGFTGGIAGQGSIGHFEGGAIAGSLADYQTRETMHTGNVFKKWNHGQKRWMYHTYPVGQGPNHHSGWIYVRPVYERVKVNHDSSAGAGIGAEINMEGWSSSNSYRYQDGNTEAMGTFVDAGTLVNTGSFENDWDNGIASSKACITGGYVAAGGAATLTVQYNGTGMAKASAVGFYVGSGSLGSSFVGTATGSSHTSIQTIPGMNGSASTASANMSVTAISSQNNPQ